VTGVLAGEVLSVQVGRAGTLAWRGKDVRSAIVKRGLTEDRVHIGDTYTVGDGAVVQVSQPRGPCFKIAARWGSRTLPNELAKGLKAGFYLRVLEPGDVGAGDPMTLVDRVSDVSVAEVLRVTYRDRHDPPALGAVVDVPELAEQWRAALVKLSERHALPLRDPVAD
jgi:MOSC domain-containing protein YiiM